MIEVFITDIQTKVQANKILNTIQIDKDRKSTRLNSSHVRISYAVFCLKKKKVVKVGVRDARCGRHEVRPPRELLRHACVEHTVVEPARTGARGATVVDALSRASPPLAT